MCIYFYKLETDPAAPMASFIASSTVGFSALFGHCGVDDYGGGGVDYDGGRSGRARWAYAPCHPGAESGRSWRGPSALEESDYMGIDSGSYGASATSG